MDGPTVQTLQVNGLQMRVTLQGQGPLVLLAHGFPELSHSWCHQVAALAAAGFRVAAPDMRGYGGTTAPVQRNQRHPQFRLSGQQNAIEGWHEPKRARRAGASQ